MDYNWFSYKQDFGLKKSINKKKMVLKKYEDFPELSVKQFVIHSSPNSPSRWCVVFEKTKH